MSTQYTCPESSCPSHAFTPSASSRQRPAAAVSSICCSSEASGFATSKSRLAHAPGAVRLPVMPGTNLIKQALGRDAGELHLADGLLGLMEDEQPAIAPRVDQLVQQELDAAAADLQAQVLAGHAFERVRF